MKSILYTLLIALGITLFAACDQSSSIGNILADENITIVVDSNFTITGSSRLNSVVQSRTLNQLVGEVEAKGYGHIYSDYVGQFMPTLTIDTTGVTTQSLDSVKLFMYMPSGNFVGDSLVPMGIDVYRLTRDLPYPIYSNFDPQGYYDPAQKLGSSTFIASTVNEPDSIKKYGGTYATVKLPISFAHEMFNAYKANPSIFSSPSAFAKDIFKGFYIKSSYGSGRISDFYATSIRIFYHKNVWNADSNRYDLKKLAGDYFAATPEVVVNNNIRYEAAQAVKDLVAQGNAVMVAPAGYEIDFRMPLPEILASYNRYDKRFRVVNSLSLEIPAEAITNQYDIAPPTQILLVLKNKKSEFFAKNMLTDDVTSFYAVYNSTSKSYKFTGLRAYMMKMLEQDKLTEDDYTFSLVPIKLTFETNSTTSTQILSTIVPYVTKPAMAKFNLDKAKIKLTFSAGTNKN